MLLLVLITFAASALSVSQSKIRGFSDRHTIIFDSTYQIENDLEKTYYSDYVFVGKILEVNETSFNDLYNYPTTIVQVEVIEELKGELQNSSIELEVFGGEIDNVLYTVDGDTFKPNGGFLQEDDYFMFFLFKDLESGNNRMEINSTELAIYLSSSSHDYIESDDYIYYLDLVENDLTIYDDIVIDDGDGGGGGTTPPSNDGSSMTKAIQLSPGTQLVNGLSPGEIVYYTFESSIYREINVEFDYSSISLYVNILDHVGALAQTETIPAYYGNFDSHIFGNTMYIKVQNNDIRSGSFHIEYNNNSSTEYCINNPYNLQFWYDSIDGNKMNWRSDSIYTDEIEHSFQQWDNESSINFAEVSSDQDLFITDYTNNGSTTIAYYNSITNKIKLNSYHFVEMTTAERHKTIMHEIGHALGLDHMSKSTNNSISEDEFVLNVMFSGKRSQSILGGCDKYVDYHRND